MICYIIVVLHALITPLCTRFHAAQIGIVHWFELAAEWPTPYSMYRHVDACQLHTDWSLHRFDVNADKLHTAAIKCCADGAWQCITLLC